MTTLGTWPLIMGASVSENGIAAVPQWLQGCVRNAIGHEAELGCHGNALPPSLCPIQYIVKRPAGVEQTEICSSQRKGLLRHYLA
jgi:hypothetical protein